MTEQSDELKKMVAIATDMALPGDLRSKAITQIGNVRTHEALLALLELAGNEGMVKKDRELALKRAKDIIKASPT